MQLLLSWDLPPQTAVRLAAFVVEQLDLTTSLPALDAALEAVVAASAQRPPEVELRRRAARDMLRNRSYKPTGRGKPASEYLARAAAEGNFPRINPAVDALNMISLREMLPISLFDFDRACGQRAGVAAAVPLVLSVRLGGEAEAFVFNQSGQQLALTDLVCGCVGDNESSQPIITPIKDCHATKVDQSTHAAVALIYFPRDVDEQHAGEICTDFAGWLSRCGAATRVAWAFCDESRPSVELRSNDELAGR